MSETNKIVMKISDDIYRSVESTYGKTYETLGSVPAQKITRDVLSSEKPVEQIAIIERYCGPLTGKKLLEVGSGFGIFTVVARKRNIEAYGVEPDSESFGGSFKTSQEILTLNDLNPNIVTSAIGEALPFADNSFDVVYSTNVLEHVTDPKKCLAEAVRVCKPGGFIQIVVPNYGSFYDGHYASFYLPYQPKWLWKLFLKIVHKKDTAYVDTLRTEINYWSVNRWLKPLFKNRSITAITFGEEIFTERMQGINFSTWAGLEKVKSWLSIVHKLKLVKLVTWLLVVTKSYSPLIITLKKNG